MDEITEYLWQEQLAPPPAVAAATPPADAAEAAQPPEHEQSYQPTLDQLLRALSDPEVREALVKLLQPR